MLNTAQFSLSIARTFVKLRALLLTLFIILPTMGLFAQPSPGDIMFVAYNGDGDDGFAIVALTDIPANSTVYFNDNEWNGQAIGSGGAFDGTGEGEMTWDTGSATITAGTVIVFDEIDNASNTNYGASVGTLSGTTALGASDEVIYAFVGTDENTPTIFLSAIANDEFLVANGELTNTGLTAGVDAVAIDGDEDVMVYSGSTVCNGTRGDCAAQIANTANWSTDDGSGSQDDDGNAPDFPDDVPSAFTGTALVAPADVTGPVLVASDPMDDRINFVGTTITLAFNEDIVKGTGRIRVLDATDDSEITGAGVNSARVTITDNEATIDLINALPFGTEYYVNIPLGAFEDEAGNEFAGLLDKTSLNGSTPTIPALSGSTPMDNRVDYNGTTLSLQFDQDMLAGTGRISVFDAADDSEITGAGVSSSRVTFTNNVVTLDLINPLPFDKDVYVKIPASALKGTNNNFFPGILDKTTLNFSSATIPELVGATPLDETTQYVGTTISLSFDRDMFAGVGRIQVMDASDDSEITGAGVSSPRVTFSNNTVTFDMINALPLDKQAYVRIPASALKDGNDIFYPGILDETTLNFSGATSPTLTASTPSDDGTDFSGTTLTLNFDRDVFAGVGRIQVLDAADDSEVRGAGVGSPRVTFLNNTVTLDLINPLPLDKQVYVSIPASAIKDVNDIFFPGILDKTTLNFASSSTPQLVSSSPSDDAMNFSGTTLTFTFDRNVQADRGRLGVFNAADDTELAGSGVSGPRVTITDNVVTLDMINPLPVNTNVYVMIPASAFKDSNNLHYAGILDKTTINFDTDMAPSTANMINLEPAGKTTPQGRLIIYPNPASREITLDLSGLEGAANVQIVGIDGAQILREDEVEGSVLKVDVSAYKTGVYLVMAQAAGGEMVFEKFMIKR